MYILGSTRITDRVPPENSPFPSSNYRYENRHNSVNRFQPSPTANYSNYQTSSNNFYTNYPHNNFYFLADPPSTSSSDSSLKVINTKSKRWYPSVSTTNKRTYTTTRPPKPIYVGPYELLPTPLPIAQNKQQT